MTGRVWIATSLEQINALGVGQIMSPEDAARGLVLANALLGNLSAEKLMVPSSRRDLLAITPGTQSYTLGPTGAWNIPRPIALMPSNFVHTATGLRNPVQIVSQDDWQDIMEQTIPAIQPVKLYDNFDFPISTAFLWPIPSQAGFIELYSWAQLAALATIDTELVVPTGYDDPLIQLLALRMAPGWVGRVDPNLVTQAAQAKAVIQALNAGPLPGAAQVQPMQRAA